MEYRAQTYLGALQLLAVIGGTLLLRMAVRMMGDGPAEQYAAMGFPDPLGFARPLNEHGWLLVVVPLTWIGLTIRGEMSDRRWASKRLTIGSGIVILMGLGLLFGAGAVRVVRMVF